MVQPDKKIAIPTKAWYLSLFGLISIAVYLILHRGLWEASLNDLDSLSHYNISRYSWRHTHLFFNSWGKPFFTLVSSPFSQLGYIGIQFYNILACLVTSYCAGMILGQSHKKWAWLAIVLTGMQTVMLNVAVTGLTEPTFAMVLSLGIGLIVTNRNISGAIILSFLPYCRTEGFYILAIIFIWLLFTNKWKYILFLAFGTLVYSLAAKLLIGNNNWLIGEYGAPLESYNPYGHGKWDHFIGNLYRTNGIINVVLIIPGLIFWTLKLTKRFKFSNLLNSFSICLSIILLFYTIHTISWATGTHGSAGMIRVMASVAPMFGVCTSFGIIYV